MTPEELDTAIDTMARIIVAQVKANRKRAADAKTQSEGVQPSQTVGTPDESSDSI